MTRYICALALTWSLAMAADPIPAEQTMASVSDRRTGPIEVAVPEVETFLSKAPPVGVHPRILCGPEDLPAIRERWEKTACGRRASGAVKSWVGSAIGKDDRLGLTWKALVAGDTAAIDKAGSSWWQGQVSLTLALAGLQAWVMDDAALGHDTAAALTTYARVVAGAKGSTMDKNLAYAYDFAHPAMSDEQRATVRQVIAAATAGKRSHGMEMEPQRRTYNWMPHGMQLVLMALAIEGEDGYDPEIYQLSVPVMRDFLTYGVEACGTPRESMHYYHYGMGTGGAESMIAMARRGDNLFGHPHYLATRSWYVTNIEPFGYVFSQHGDTPNDGGGLLGNYVALKWVFRDDPVVDFVWRNRVRDNYGGINARFGFIMAALYGLDWEGGDASEAAPKSIEQWGVDTAEQLPRDQLAAPWEPARLGLPLSFYSPDRGFLVTRTGWDKQALVLHAECKMDETGPSHAHANRNGFTLSALGEKWAIDRGFHIAESKHHNVVLIDGQGEGFFCPPGQAVSYLDSPQVTGFVGDAKYAYDYRYTFSSRLGSPENQGYEWEDEPLAPEGSMTRRAVSYPVQKALRSFLLVRGPHPYVVIADDLRKDDAEHLYEWLMQVPDDVELLSIQGDDAILGRRAEGAPRLLVRVLGAAQTADNRRTDIVVPIRLETYEVRRSPNTGSNERKGLGKRLVITSLSVEPKFRILLYPHPEGAPLPTLAWKDDIAALSWDDQQDQLAFTPTGVELRRQELHAKLAVDRHQPSTCEDGDTLYVSAGDPSWPTFTVPRPFKRVRHDGTVAQATSDKTTTTVTPRLPLPDPAP